MRKLLGALESIQQKIIHYIFGGLIIWILVSTIMLYWKSVVCVNKRC